MKEKTNPMPREVERSNSEANAAKVFKDVNKSHHPYWMKVDVVEEELRVTSSIFTAMP